MANRTEHDIAFIQALADLLKDSDLSEIEVEREYGADDELKVRLSRATLAVAQPVVNIPVAPPAPVAPATDSSASTSGTPALNMVDRVRA